MNDALLSKSVEAGPLGTAGALIVWDRTRGQRQIETIGSLSSIVYVLFTKRCAGGECRAADGTSGF